MAFDDLSKFTEQQIESALAPLRRAAARIEKIIKSGAGSEFDTFAALTKKVALEDEMRRLEGELKQRIGGAAESMAGRAAAQAGEEMPGSTPVRVDAAAVQAAQRAAADQVVGVARAVRTQLNVAVVDALTGHSDRPAFDAAIRDAMGADVLEHRVERIARTELSKVYMGQQAAADVQLANTPGVDLIKRWVKSGKGAGRSRPEHDAIHGQERELDDLFDIGGGATAATPPGGGQYRAMGPLDPALPASQAIGCGCDVVRVSRSEAQQPYIEKRPRNVQTAAQTTQTAA